MIHSPEGVDELIKYLADAKQEAWKASPNGGGVAT